MSKRTPFNLRDTMHQAWDWLWADNLKSRAEHPDHAANTYYLTASDLESQVRAFAYDDMQNHPRGWAGRGCYASVSIRISGLNGMSLLNHCREWLLRNPTLDRHNMGKGHTSGMRYRPAGQPLGPSEVKTLAVKQAQKDGTAIMHFRDTTARFFSAFPICTAERRAANRAKSHHYVNPRGSKSSASTTNDKSKVTCPKCLAAIAKIEATPPAIVS